jgi:hypothetical protein
MRWIMKQRHEDTYFGSFSEKVGRFLICHDVPIPRGLGARLTAHMSRYLALREPSGGVAFIDRRK